LKKFLLLLLLVGSVSAQELSPYIDYRRGTEVVRNADGTAKRSQKVLNEYKKLHPCPSTGMTFGACPGWALNHAIPLACGGKDIVINLIWVPNKIKSCADKSCIDRHEREINEYGVPDSDSCTNKFPIVLE